MRSTAAIANFLAYYFEMIFDNVRVITSGSQTETFEQIFRITDKDVMIGISFPRYSSMSVEAMDFARSRGAHAIAITDSMVSPLVQSADSVLIARSDMASIVDSLVAPLSLINALIVATVLKKKDEVSDTFRRLELVWNRDGVYTNRDREIMGNIEDDDSKKVVVIGAGAAGLMAGATAALYGASVTIIEKNKRVGRKIMITGKGRCNLANNCDVQTFINNVPVNGRFLYSAINAFTPEDTIEFFESKGLKTKTERGNRVFPASDKSVDVVDTMHDYAVESGCKNRV